MKRNVEKGSVDHPMPLQPLFPLPQVLWQDLPQICESHKTSEDTHWGTAVQVGATWC